MKTFFVPMVMGIFFGAFAIELLKRNRPELLSSFQGSAKGTLDAFRESFRDGYHGLEEDEE